MTEETSTPDPGRLPDRLLVAAAEEITATGLDKLSLRAVARRVGVSHQTPAHFFGSRSGLLTALEAYLVRLVGEQMLDAAAAARAAGASPWEVVVEIGVRYIVFTTGQPALFTLTSRSDLLENDDPRLRAERDKAWAVLTEAVHEAQRAGWNPHENPDVAAMTCWSIVHGLAVIWRDRIPPQSLQTTRPEELVRSIARLLAPE